MSSSQFSVQNHMGEKSKAVNIILVQFILFMTLFVIGADTFIVSPLIPSIRDQFHVSVAQGGLLVTAYSITYAIFAFFFGPLSDRVGRRVMLVYGMLFFTVFSLLCGLSSNFWWLFVFRGLSGVAAAATSPQIWASIGDLIPFEKRGRAMGITSAALSISQLLGVPMGAYIAGVWTWHFSFIALSVLSGLIFLLIAFGFPAIQRSQQGGKALTRTSIATTLLQVLSSRRAVMGLGVTFFMMMASLGTYTYLGSWLGKTYGLSVDIIGAVSVVVGLGNLVGNLFGGFLADRLSKRTVVLGSLYSIF